MSAVLNTLREQQRAFAKAVFEAKDEHFSGAISVNGLSAELRLQLYRNNIFIGLRDALRAVYPVVERLVGEAFFVQLCERYITRQPPVSGNLHDFGDVFAKFLAALPDVSSLPYLSDAARLEWAYHRVFHDADSTPLDMAALAGMDQSHYERLRFRLAPSVYLIHSPYPIARIWEVNQTDFEGAAEVDLDAGANRLVVVRSKGQVVLHEVGEGEFALLSACAEGMAFAQACMAACDRDPECDVSIALQHAVHKAILVDFEIE